MLYFVHIPKTAGTTLATIINQKYPSYSILRVYGADDLSFIKSLSQAELRSVEVLIGHVLLGWNLEQSVAYTPYYVTVLRDPAERMISHYHHVLRQKTHYLHELVVAKNMSLEDYACSGIAPELDNGQTRQLCGIDVSNIPYGECSVEMLEAAKANLRERFNVVGLTERFDETLILLRHLLGWTMPYYLPQNTGTNRPKRSAVQPEAIRAIELSNSLDIELYNYAQILFNEAVAKQSMMWKLELKFFQSINFLRSQISKT